MRLLTTTSEVFRHPVEYPLSQRTQASSPIMNCVAERHRSNSLQALTVSRSCERPTGPPPTLPANLSRPPAAAARALEASHFPESGAAVRAFPACLAPTLEHITSKPCLPLQYHPPCPPRCLQKRQRSPGRSVWLRHPPGSDGRSHNSEPRASSLTPFVPPRHAPPVPETWCLPLCF